jgi:putative transposase
MELLPALGAEPERAATGRSAAIMGHVLRLGYHTSPSTENTTMTKPSIVMSDLLGKGADAGLLRQMIEHVVQRVMEFDIENLCNAGYGERSAERANSRNGYRERLWETRAGSIPVKIPSCARGATSRRSSSRVARLRKPSPP